MSAPKHMRLAGTGLLLLAIGSTSGCGWLWGKDGYFRDRGSDYLTAREAEPMKVPDGVQVRRTDPLLPIPASIPMSAANEFEAPRPQPLQAREVSDFSVQKSGDSRWLVAQRAPAEVWPVAIQLLADNGFRVVDERPQAGEFSSDWRSLSSLGGSLAAGLEGRNSGDVRVRVRVEPGVQRNTTEVFILTADRSSEQWPASSSVPGLENALLDDLQARLVQNDREGGSISLLAAKDYNYDAPGRVTLEQGSDGVLQLNLDASFDRAWSSVGRALQESDLQVEDLNRSQALYYINLAQGAGEAAKKPGFFARLFGFGKPSKEELEARAERYQVRLTTQGDSVKVTLEKDANTFAPPEVARRVLELLEEKLD